MKLGRTNVRRLRQPMLLAAFGIAASTLCAPLFAQSQQRYYDGSDRGQYDYRDRYGDDRGRDSYQDRYYSRNDPAMRWSRDAMQWRDQRSGRNDQQDWRDRMSMRDYDRYRRGSQGWQGAQGWPDYQDRYGGGRGIPSYPRDFYAGRGPDQYDGRQFMAPGFDYYDFYGSDRASNRPESSQWRADRGEQRWSRDRYARGQWGSRYGQSFDDYGDARGNEMADARDRDRMNSLRERNRMRQYEDNFAGGTDTGRNDVYGRGSDMPDYYQSDRGQRFHGNRAQWQRMWRDQQAARMDEQMGQNRDSDRQTNAQNGERRGGPPIARARAGTDTTPESAQAQSNIPGQSQTAVGHPDKAQTTGQGQGVIESGANAVKQPDTQIPEQSMTAVGHPDESEPTGQGGGVAEQPAGNAANKSGSGNRPAGSGGATADQSGASSANPGGASGQGK